MVLRRARCRFSPLPRRHWLVRALRPAVHLCRRGQLPIYILHAAAARLPPANTVKEPEMNNFTLPE